MRISDERLAELDHSLAVHSNYDLRRGTARDLIADLRDARAQLAKAEALIPKRHATFNGWGLDRDKCPCSTCKEIRDYFDANARETKREGAE